MPVHATRSPSRTVATPGPAAVTTPAPSMPGHEREGVRVEARAVVDVDEVDARGLHADDDLPGPRRGLGHLGETQDLGAAEAVDSNGLHGMPPPWSPYSVRRVVLRWRR